MYIGIKITKQARKLGRCDSYLQNISHLPSVLKKNRIMWGKFPYWGGGGGRSDPIPLVYVSLPSFACQNEVLKGAIKVLGFWDVKGCLL